MTVFNDYQEGKILIIKEGMTTSVAFHSNHVEKKDMCTSFSYWKIQKKSKNKNQEQFFVSTKMINIVVLIVDISQP